MDARLLQVIVWTMTGNADRGSLPDPADRILALEELRDLGLLDENEFAVAAAASLDEHRSQALERASLGQGNRVEGD